MELVLKVENYPATGSDRRYTGLDTIQLADTAGSTVIDQLS